MRERIERLKAWFDRTRQKHAQLDHLVRAIERFNGGSANRLAAAVTYNAFLAMFPVLLLAFALIGYLVNIYPDASKVATTYLENNLPTFDVEALTQARYAAGIIGAIGVILTGSRWVDVTRTSIRSMWNLTDKAENMVLAKVFDVVALVGLGLVLTLSVAVSAALRFAIGWLLPELGIQSTSLHLALNVLGFILAVGVNMVLFTALLSPLPRIRMPFSVLRGPVIIGAIGFEVLKRVGELLIGQTTSNPAYAVVAGAVGLLLFLNFFNQLLLFCAALTATSSAVLDEPANTRVTNGDNDDDSQRGKEPHQRQGAA